MWAQQFAAPPSVETLAAETGVAAAAAQFLVMFEGRPRGSPASALVEVPPSCTVELPKATTV